MSSVSNKDKLPSIVEMESNALRANKVIGTLGVLIDSVAIEASKPFFAETNSSSGIIIRDSYVYIDLSSYMYS